VIWHEFKALGTDIIISAELPPEQKNILLQAEIMVRDFEQKFSRFINNNELAAFNNSTSERREVSINLRELLKVAQYYYFETKGIFDPTIIGNLKALGYKQSFEKTNSDSHVERKELNKTFFSRALMSDIKINDNSIECPSNFQVDLGGLGKGYLVDVLSQTVLAGVQNYWISAGGDLIVQGELGRKIAVQDPSRPEADIFIIDTKGEKLGVATSGIIKRAGMGWHHLIDPRTGLPTTNDILSVTAIAPDALRADIFAKTVLILGIESGFKFIEKQVGAAAIIFTKNQDPIFSKRAKDYLYDTKKN